MNESNILDKPQIHSALERKSAEINFSMPSDLYIGTLLKSLVASKPKGRFLELGTGIGLSLSWMADGMDSESKLISIDNDSELIEIAQNFFGNDERLEIRCEDGGQWIQEHSDLKFDLIFADAWPGKYDGIEQILDMVNVGGFYIIDDMIAQPNWPEGHENHVERLVHYLEERNDFTITKMGWSTGLIIAVRK